MTDPITTPEALDALLAIAGEQAEPVVVREGFRVWTLTEGEDGRWYAWSWTEDESESMPIYAESLTLPLTVLFRPVAPATAELHDVSVYAPTAEERDGARDELIRRARPDAPTPTPAEQDEVARLTAERDAAQEHLAHHLRDFRPGADDKATGDLAVDMAAYAGRLKAERDALLAARPSPPTVTTEQVHCASIRAKIMPGTLVKALDTLGIGVTP